MRIKYVTALVLVAIAAIIYLNLGSDSLTHDVPKSEMDAVINSKPTNKNRGSEQKTRKKADDPQLTKSRIVLDKIAESISIDDPVVAANMVIKNNMSCINHLSAKRKSADYTKLFEQKLDKNQKKFYRGYFKYCQELDKQHPEWNLSDISKLQKLKKSAVATSLWGQILNREINQKQLSETEIRTILKQNDLNILSDAPKLLEDYYLNVIHWELEDVLQNHQYEYTNHIRLYAHQLYLCDLGANCGPQSSIMASLCYLNTHSCGLDYPHYVSDILTAGQQADIQLAMNYLNRKYQ
jgi:hypothetical protein